MHRVLFDPRPLSAHRPGILFEFYREELIKHQRCLQRQREYYSERAYASAEKALSRLLAQLDQLCRSKNADQVMCRLLRQFDVVTNLSAWSDPNKVN
ncbi:MAG TPA: hypothetical protein VGK32_09860 [Vicinamibacterales bacterium]|jgi:hypothetical protein